MDVVDLATAQKMAVASARDIRAERVKTGGLVCLGASLEVADTNGNILLTIPFADTVTLVPA